MLRRSVIGLAACLLFSSIPLIAQNAPSALHFRTSPDCTDARPAIREFIQSVQRDLHGTLGFPFPDAGSPEIGVEIGFSRPIALSSCHRLVRYRTGRIGAVIMIPDPKALDPTRLRFDAVAGIFKSELLNRARRDVKVTEPPEWFLAGLAATSDSSRRMRDFEQAYGHWAHASLDGAAALISTSSRAKDIPCVAAQIAAWCVDRPDRGECWTRLLDSLATGEPWTAVTIGLAFMATGNSDALDTMFDEWMHARARRIFTPGLTPPGALSRLRLAFMVFADEVSPEMRPTFNGKTMLPLSSFARNPDLPSAKKLLSDRAMRIRTAALGRDGEFARMCALYADALETSAQNGWFSASAKWLAAEEMRVNLETRAAAGEMIGEIRTK